MIVRVSCRLRALIEFQQGSAAQLNVVFGEMKEDGWVQMEVDLDKYLIDEPEFMTFLLVRRPEG